MPPKTIQLSKSIGPPSREPGRMERSISQTRLAVDLGALSPLPGSTRRRHWEPCHGGRKLPRLTLIYFGIAVYCGNYACP